MVLTRSDLRRVLAAGLLMPLASLPLLVLFFPLLPRTQIPLWNLFPAPAARVTGFSDRVEPGRAENIDESRVPAFRVEMPRLAQSQLYWRAIVFNRVEGNRWQRDSAVPSERIAYSGVRVHQTIYPEPGFSRTLVALDTPAAIALPRVKQTPDGIFEWQDNPSKRLGYRAESVSSGILAVAAEPDRAFYLELPKRIAPRIRQLSDDIRRRGRDDSHRVELLETFFRSNNFRYSMHGLATGEHALEQFLFERRQGQCEFFASAFGLILRGAGVPARLVAGYLGGEYNELGGYYLISEEMAHVWVEAFITGKGWVRIDPSSLAQNADEVWARPRSRDWRARLRLGIDSLNHSWNRTVITYDLERQVEAARTVGKRLQGLEMRKVLRTTLQVALALAGLGGLLVPVFRGRYLRASREERLLRSFYRRVELDCGITPGPGRHGLFEIAAATAGNEKVREFAEIYAGAVYRDRRLTPEERTRLKQIVREGFKEPFP
jgi:protein-glutamine gamma-glutamyltransferase